MVASHRQNRPQMPKDWCPFCPSGGRVPDYDVYAYDNDFPALSQEPPQPDDVATDFFKAAPAYGKCEVILFSPEHTKTLKELPKSHIEKLVGLWRERFEALSRDEKIKYVFIFENRGDAVGVTMPHPHGQIYAYGFIPKKIQLMDASLRKSYENGKCLYCELRENEAGDGRRVIFENGSFTVFLPFFCEYPYGIHIAAKRHAQNITDLSGEECADLADALKKSAGTLDSLFGYDFPYTMCMYNAPVNSGEMPHHHFHIAYYPPMRSADKQKYNGSSETGAWAHCNSTAPEATAEELRAAYRRFLSGESSGAGD